MYEAETVSGSLTATWTFAETSTWPPGAVNGGLGETLATRMDSSRSVSWPGVLRVISGAPSAVAVTVKLAGMSVVPVSVRVSVTGLFEAVTWAARLERHRRSG